MGVCSSTNRTPKAFPPTSSAEARSNTVVKRAHQGHCDDNASSGQVWNVADVPDIKQLRGFVPPIRRGKVIKVYDGDTITVGAPLTIDGSQQFYKFSVRLRNIDCPEIRTRDADEKEVAIIARDTLSDKIMGRIVDFEDLATDKYGRLLARVLFEHADMSAFMIEKRLAVPYAGRTKTPVCWKTHYQSASGEAQQ